MPVVVKVKLLGFIPLINLPMASETLHSGLQHSIGSQAVWPDLNVFANTAQGSSQPHINGIATVSVLAVLKSQPEGARQLMPGELAMKRLLCGIDRCRYN